MAREMKTLEIKLVEKHMAKNVHMLFKEQQKERNWSTRPRPLRKT